jgi:hypothetical protein
MERAVERERPAFGVTRAAALAAVAARGARHDRATGVHLPGNGAGLRDEGGLAAQLPAAPRPGDGSVPRAMELITRPAWTAGPGAIVLDPCTACGGATRVAALDLTSEAATIECVACGLRRWDVAVEPARPDC